MILFNPKFGFQTASIVADKNGRSLIVGVTVHDWLFRKRGVGVRGAGCGERGHLKNRKMKIEKKLKINEKPINEKPINEKPINK